MPRNLLNAALAGLAGLLLLAACSSPASAPGGSTTVPASAAGGSTTSTTSTTTTLPPSILLAGTTPPGAFAFLGAVMRVAVAPPPAGGTTAPAGDGAGDRPATVEVGYRQFGSGPDLLLVMGQAGSMSWWSPALLQALAQHFRVTIFDLPGVGYSGPDPAARADDAMGRDADVTAGLVAAIGLRRPIVLGWGMGGEIALELALRHGADVSRLVLVDTSAGGPDAVPTPAAVAAVLGSPTATPARLSDLLFPARDAGERAAWLLDAEQEQPDDVVADTVSAEAAAQADWWRGGVASARLAAVTLPTLVVWGTADDVFPTVDAADLAAVIPHARTQPLEGAGYASIFADVPTFVSALVTFASS